MAAGIATLNLREKAKTMSLWKICEDLAQQSEVFFSRRDSPYINRMGFMFTSFLHRCRYDFETASAAIRSSAAFSEACLRKVFLPFAVRISFLRRPDAADRNERSRLREV
jgi:hypothetical protein